MCDDCAVPTHPGRKGWLFETVANTYPPKDDEHSGKWCFYVPAQQIDSLWLNIRGALAWGKLGKKAKTGKVWYRQNSTSYIVVVYTYNATDHADVFRIAQELINLGINDAFYKTDEQTHERLYNGPMALKQGGYRPLYRIDQGMILSQKRITS